MNDPMEKLETELMSMQPRATSGELLDQIEAILQTQPSRWADRMLMTAMSAGALAACVIVGMLMHDSRSPSTAVPLAVADQPIYLTDSPLAFARTDPGWIDAVK